MKVSDVKANPKVKASKRAVGRRPGKSSRGKKDIQPERIRTGTLRNHNGANRPFHPGRFWAWLWAFGFNEAVQEMALCTRRYRHGQRTKKLIPSEGTETAMADPVETSR